MKSFDLNAALVGEPVKLRNGSKAYVLAKIPDNLKYDKGKEVPYPLVGIILGKDDYISDSHVRWTLKGGCYFTNEPLRNDIVGMWEEPVKTQGEILEEAWQNKGKVVKTDAGMTTTVEVIGKVVDGEYIVRNPVDGSLDEISAYGKWNWQPYEEPTGPVDNHRVATLYLPKPIKPKEGEEYWCIGKAVIGKLCVERVRFSHSSHTDRIHSEQGNCFASELDAEQWIYALGYARANEVQYEGLDKNS